MDPKHPSADSPADRVESLPLGERWFPDAFATMSGPGGFALRLVDMTRAKVALKILRDAKVPATFTHLIVRAAAIALARNPELHQMVVGYKRLTPGQVDIGLSMAGETTYAPVVVLPAADKASLGSLVVSTNLAIKAAKVKEQVDLANMRKIMWVIPFGFLRRFIIRLLNGSIWFRRKLVGTFQISCLASVDVISSFLFYTGSILGAGAIRDRVLAVDGQPVVRPTVWLTITVDHASMDGRRAGELMGAIKGVLEGEELVTEARDAAAASAPDMAASRDDDSPPRGLPAGRGVAERSSAGGVS